MARTRRRSTWTRWRPWVGDMRLLAGCCCLEQARARLAVDRGVDAHLGPPAHAPVTQRFPRPAPQPSTRLTTSARAPTRATRSSPTSSRWAHPCPRMHGCMPLLPKCAYVCSHPPSCPATDLEGGLGGAHCAARRPAPAAVSMLRGEGCAGTGRARLRFYCCGTSCLLLMRSLK